MPTENLNYQGINRALTDYASSSACEELINLRPTSQGLVPVKPFTAKSLEYLYTRVYEHRPGGVRKLIALRPTTLDGIKIVMLTESEGTITETLIGNLGSNLSPDAISFATAGNIMLFSVCDRSNGGTYFNKAYIWKNNAYVEIEATAPTVTFGVLPAPNATDAVQVKKTGGVKFDGESIAEWIDKVGSATNKIQEENPDLCFGPIIIAIAFKTNDGKTFWTGQWAVYDPTNHIKYHIDGQLDLSSNTFINSTNVPSEGFERDYVAAHTSGYVVAKSLLPTYDETNHVVYIAGVPVKVTLSIPSGSWNKNTSIIRSIEIYASKPRLYTDTREQDTTLFSYYMEDPHYNGYLWEYILPQLPYEDMELDGQMLYHMDSIPMEELSAGNAVQIGLRFGGNQQVTEETLEVDSGATNWYGKLLSYNARFHYFDAVSKRGVGMPYFSMTSGTNTTVHIFVKWEDEDQSEILYLGTQSMPDGVADIVIAPSLNIKEVMTYCAPSGSTRRLVTYKMMASTTYNYTICVNPPSLPAAVSGGISPYEGMVNNHETRNSVISYEPSAINVTEQYNPFVFMVEHSYLAPGKVLDVQPQMVTYTDATFGIYPLNVFTERGLYALLQGSANVLYGAFQPISNLVTQRNSIPTEMGTFFLSGGALWLISGRRTTLISDALHLGPHKYIRTCQGFKELCMGTAAGGSVQGYNVAALLSQVTFDTYVQNASLTYNRHRDELYISNPNYAYSYALSLKYRQWFKIDRSLRQDSAGGTIAVGLDSQYGMVNTVIDFTSEGETSVLTHLQSRPFSFGYRYSHIHRIVSMVRACLTNSEKLIVGLYGSDDLQEWTLLSYAYRSGVSAQNPLKVSQIRTSSSGRSWRYYTVCIGGTTPTDTDFGPFLVDFQSIIRRIG